jgi:hypothetical protein
MIIMLQALVLLLSCGCVTHLYVRFATGLDLTLFPSPEERDGAIVQRQPVVLPHRQWNKAKQFFSSEKKRNENQA